MIGLSDGIISMFFSPTLAKMLATLLVAMVLVFRPQGLFGTGRDEWASAKSGLAAASGGDRAAVRRAICAAGLSSRRLARVMVLAVFAMGYNLPVRLHRPAQPRPCDVFSPPVSMARA
jgi:ABC-type branched-subunit amino acid transport system permease subunit